MGRNLRLCWYLLYVKAPFVVAHVLNFSITMEMRQTDRVVVLVNCLWLKPNTHDSIAY